MIVAGWAWDDRVLLVQQQVPLSVQESVAILLFAVGFVGLLVAGLAALETWWTNRRWRRDILAAHQPRPFDRERDAA